MIAIRTDAWLSVAAGDLEQHSEVRLSSNSNGASRKLKKGLPTPSMIIRGFPRQGRGMCAGPSQTGTRASL
jgi:hypothetical protein